MAQIVKCCAISAVVFGIALIVVSIAGFTLFPKLVSSKIKEKIALHEDSDAYARWSKLSVPMFMRFYFFDVINADDVMQGIAVPIVVEKGPYTFRETREKKNVVINATLGTIAYQQFKGFYFVPEQSVGPLNDSVTVVDVTTAALVKKFGNFFFYRPLNRILESEKQRVFNKFTVKELIYGHRIAATASFVERVKELNVDLSGMVPTKFGLLMDKNETADGDWLIDSGILHIEKLQKVISWNHQKKLNKWSDYYCDMINGTDGSRFHPGVEPTDILRAFTPDICRSIYLIYEQKSSVEGISTLRFRLPDKFWAAPNREPDNKCFCTSNDEHICGLDGIMDISECRKKAPVFISGPHFIKGDQWLRDSIQGLKVDEKLHDTYIDVEPLSGAVLNAARRIQLNVHIQPNSYIDSFANLKQQFIVPLCWLDEVATVDPVTAGKLKAAVFDKLKLFKILAIVGCCVGIVMIVGGLILWFIQKRKQFVNSNRRKSEVSKEKEKMFN